MSTVVRAEASTFILSAKNLLELAFDIEDAMLGGPGRSTGNPEEGVRVLLIKAILETLKSHVITRLGLGWEIKINPLALWGEMTIRLPGWPMLRDTSKGPPVSAEIRLANTVGNWRNVCIGFRAPRFTFSGPGRTSLTAALLPVMRQASENEGWAALEYPSHPFNNWWDKDFLIEIGYAVYRAKADRSVPLPRQINELGDHLVCIAETAARAVPAEWSVQSLGSA